MAHKQGLLLALAAVWALGGRAYAQAGDPVAGTLQIGYVNFDASGHHTNDWAALGSVVFTLTNPGFNFQLNASNDNLDTPEFSSVTKTTTKSITTAVATSTRANAAHWQYGGDVFWRDWAGDFGINASGDRATSNTSSTTVTSVTGEKPSDPVKTSFSHDNTFENVGLFGEYFVLPNLTLRGKGGWIAGDMRGYYLDGALVYYPFRQIALSVGPDYAGLTHDTHEEDIAANFEYMPVPSVPVSMRLGYTYARYHGLAGALKEHDNIFGLTLKAYLGGRGTSLRDYQRNGSTDWDSPQSELARLSY
jgi:hypothetical protein